MNLRERLGDERYAQARTGVLRLRHRDLTRRRRVRTRLVPRVLGPGRYVFEDRGLRALYPWTLASIPGVCIHAGTWGAVIGDVNSWGVGDISRDGWILAAAALALTAAIAALPLGVGLLLTRGCTSVEIDTDRGEVTITGHPSAGRAGRVVPIAELRITPCSLDPVGHGVIALEALVLSVPGLYLLLHASGSAMTRDAYLMELPEPLRHAPSAAFSAIILASSFR